MAKRHVCARPGCWPGGQALPLRGQTTHTKHPAQSTLCASWPVWAQEGPTMPERYEPKRLLETTLTSLAWAQ